jgi:hypothetical protein
MYESTRDEALQRLLDKEEIYETICLYARGVDRGDWDLVRSTYHEDAFDSHGDYQGDIHGLITWLENLFKGVDNSMHFLGNCLIEFGSRDSALVETYFVSRRLRAPTLEESNFSKSTDAFSRDYWGRYVDHFVRREGQWRVLHRTVVTEALSDSLALNGARTHPLDWGQRNRSDRLYTARKEIENFSFRAAI